jgi:hypothetical protein
MIQPYLFPQTSDKPQVILDSYNNIFEIKGKSYPENVNLFFNPILDWLEKYAKNPNEESIFIVNLDYCNSSSYKKIVEMILIFEKIYKQGRTAKIIWYHKEDDESIKERGEDIKMVLDIPFEIKPC